MCVYLAHDRILAFFLVIVWHSVNCKTSSNNYSFGLLQFGIHFTSEWWMKSHDCNWCDITTNYKMHRSCKIICIVHNGQDQEYMSSYLVLVGTVWRIGEAHKASFTVVHTSCHFLCVFRLLCVLDSQSEVNTHSCLHFKLPIFYIYLYVILWVYMHIYIIIHGDAKSIILL